MHPVGALQNAAHPHPWRQGIAPHPDPASVQVQWRLYTRLDVVDHGAMFKAAQEKHWQRGDGLVVYARAEVGGEGHLRDIEGQGTHHLTKGTGNRRHVSMFEHHAFGLDSTVLECLSMAVGRESSR